MSESFRVASHKGEYEVAFAPASVTLAENVRACHVIVDRRLLDLHGERLTLIKDARSILLVDATEEAKSLERMPDYVQHLADHYLRRDHRLIAIGGGVTQDIACFLAAIMLRGVDWDFYPTTLLAQADSCIGSKSSINSKRLKNIVGMFTPPRRVVIDTAFLDTLGERDMRSGFGEILKVYAIEGPEWFEQLAADYPRLQNDRELLSRHIREALSIKKRYIELDEFDRGPRQVFNYGHSFGHAIESVTDYAVPHGIAVTIGMDMANFVARQLGVDDGNAFRRMHPTLRENYRGYEDVKIDADALVGALGKDKKNIGQGTVSLILPGPNGRPFRDHYPSDPRLRDACALFLRERG